jgi:hypothetical protein
MLSIVNVTVEPVGLARSTGTAGTSGLPTSNTADTAPGMVSFTYCTPLIATDSVWIPGTSTVTVAPSALAATTDTFAGPVPLPACIHAAVGDLVCAYALLTLAAMSMTSETTVLAVPCALPLCCGRERPIIFPPLLQLRPTGPTRTGVEKTAAAGTECSVNLDFLVAAILDLARSVSSRIDRRPCILRGQVNSSRSVP